MSSGKGLMTFARKRRAGGSREILALSFLGLTIIFKVYREPREGAILEPVRSSQATVIYCMPTMFTLSFHLVFNLKS